MQISGKQFLIIEAVTVLVACIACVILDFRCIQSDTTTIIRETETITKWVKRPTSCDEYKQCMNNPLDISGRMDGPWLRVKCSDGCRESEKGFELTCKKNYPKNTLTLLYMGVYNQGKFSNMGGVQFSRSIYGPLNVSGAIYGGNNAAAVSVGAGYSW